MKALISWLLAAVALAGGGSVGADEQDGRLRDLGFKRALLSGVEFVDGMSGPVLELESGHLLAKKVEAEVKTGPSNHVVHLGTRTGADASLVSLRGGRWQLVKSAASDPEVIVHEGAVEQLRGALGVSGTASKDIRGIVATSVGNAARGAGVARVEVVANPSNKNPRVVLTYRGR
jgi:hypothetical protein